AQAARQKLADDIYRRLLVVTGIPPIRLDQLSWLPPHEPPAELLRERRWLAQLAVNIVAYIDQDDICTPFLFFTAADSPIGRANPGRTSRPDNPPVGDVPAGEIQWPLYWVFGTELPRVVLNEAMAQVPTNDPEEAYSEPVRVFVELH